jgi:hypothetical protein
MFEHLSSASRLEKNCFKFSFYKSLRYPTYAAKYITKTRDVEDTKQQYKTIQTLRH